MKRIAPPGYTQIPNAILDAMGSLSEPHLRILLAVCRHTFGWQRDKHLMSISFLMQATGLSNRAVIYGTAELVKAGHLKKETTTAGSVIGLCVSEDACEPDASAPRSQLPVNAVHREGVNGVHTSKETEERKKEKEPAASPAVLPLKAEPSKHKEFVEAWDLEYRKVMGRGYDYINRGKDMAAVKQLVSTQAEVSELVATARAAWQRAAQAPAQSWNCRQACTLSGFSSRLNEIKQELSTPLAKFKPQNRFAPAGNGFTTEVNCSL